MRQSLQTLPANYDQVFLIDLETNKTAAIVLNLAGPVVMIITFWLLAIFTNRMRPELADTSFGLSINLAGVLYVVLLIVATMGIHEIIHGFFFWLFTHSRPVFGLSLSYAFAAAPGWYIPGGLYWIIGLAPLVLIDIAGLMVMAFCPPAWLLPVAIMVGFNTGGAVGDMWIIYKLFRTSPSCLVKDTGHSIHFYMKGEMLDIKNRPGV
jgi:hypothetical protein